MKKKVYIANSVFLSGNFENIPTNRETDKIGSMCTAVLDKLFAGAIKERDVPIFFASAYSSLKSLHEFNIISEKKGALAVNPSLFPNTVLNAPACCASIRHNIKSPIYNISNGILSGIDAIVLAYSYLANDKYSNAIICVAEEESVLVELIEGKKIHNACGALYLSTKKSDVQITGFFDDQLQIKPHPIGQSTDTLKIIDHAIKHGDTNVQMETTKGYVMTITIHSSKAHLKLAERGQK